MFEEGFEIAELLDLVFKLAARGFDREQIAVILEVLGDLSEADSLRRN